MTEVMTDDIGIVQHSDIDVPIKRDKNPYPYSIDDVARALIVLSRFSFDFPEVAITNYWKYLNFFNRSDKGNGLVYNYQNLDGVPIEESCGEEDCFGRTMWARAEFLKGNFPISDKKIVRSDFIDRLGNFHEMHSAHSQAFSLIALAKFLETEKDPDITSASKALVEDLAYKLVDSYNKHSENGWNWFEDTMTYCLGRLPQSMLLASKVLGDEEEIFDVAKKSLDFLIDVSFRFEKSGGIFYGIGNEGWFTKEQFLQGKKPGVYDQQSIEASCMVEACSDFSDLTMVGEYKSIYARNAFDWFRGLNVNKSSMLSDIGGVYDAITKNGVNKNQGAESLVGYLMAWSALSD